MVVFSFKELSPLSETLFNELLDVFYDIYERDMIDFPEMPEDFNHIAEKNEQVKEAFLAFTASLSQDNDGTQ